MNNSQQKMSDHNNVRGQSPASSGSRSPRTVSNKTLSSVTVKSIRDDYENNSEKPEFIYGGPFIKVEKPQPFLNTATPINLQLQGTFKKSFAYYSLKERVPVILTKVIDNLSKQASPDARNLIQYIAKLKNDIVTNKHYEKLTVDSEEAKKWNQWIDAADSPYYFTNTWVFTECYIYRRLREGCELIPSLKDFDPFASQKEQSLTANLEPMCVVAERLATMLPESDKDKRKSDFITLLKICLWANKCDLSLSVGEQVSLKGEKKEDVKSGIISKESKESQPVNSEPLIDPFQMIIDNKDKLLVDDAAKVVDTVVAKAEAMLKAVEANTTFKAKCSCHRLATLAGMPLCKDKELDTLAAVSKKESPPSTPGGNKGSPTQGEETTEPPQIPCPSKMVVPQAVVFDIVCDNAGYELFADLCLAHFLVSQKIVQKVRFHVKKIPWFVSDVTPKDFKFVIDSCSKANFTKQVPQEAKPAGEGEAPEQPQPPRSVSADALRAAAARWAALVDDGTFVLTSDDFWTSPHVFKDMKKYQPHLYRKLQLGVAVLFKGDLNYRKLLGEKNWNPVVGFEAALQGFIPAPVIALRTVKADLICGLPKGKWEQLTALDDKWMEKGDYGVIQLCPKAEPLKPMEQPCDQYGDTCRGALCAETTL